MSRSGFTIRTAVILVLAFAANSSADYSGGTGEPNAPFEIATVADWQELMDTPWHWDQHFILTADLDVNGVDLSPVGNQGQVFTGVFDGNDHIIRNADINTPDTDVAGLFGKTGQSGHIANLGAENVAIKGNDFAGGLVGLNSYGTISNCYVSGSVNGDYCVGGLVGRNYDATITSCYSTALVDGDECVGGLVGDNFGGVIDCSYVSGSVDGRNGVGGLVGSSWRGGAVSNCYSSGSVSGWASGIGGLIGANDSTVTNCYSTGFVSAYVSGNPSVGGLAGSNYYGTINNSFWDLNTSGWATSSGGEGKTTVEIRDPNTFVSVGWDLVGESANGTDDIWSICEGPAYPRLVWQIPSADWVCPHGVGLEDFGHFGRLWETAEAGTVNLDEENGIGFGDLMIFCQQWLLERQPVIPVSQGLIGYWMFDEGSGTIAADSSGYDNTGVFAGNPGWTWGKVGHAVEFNDANDAVQIQAHGLNPNTGAIALWASAEAFPQLTHYLFGHTSSDEWNNCIQLYVQVYRGDPNGYLQLGLGDSRPSAWRIQSLETLRWYHIVITWDGESYEVYVDGEIKVNGSYEGLYELGESADIGNNGHPIPESRNESFFGMIDEVRVYNRVLSESEVREIYNLN